MRSKRYIFTLLIAIFVLFGCAREGFVVSSVSLSREIVLSVDSTGSCELENESIDINSRIEPKDGKYTFKLTSPDEDLSWEGPLNGGRGVSEDLLITPGATSLPGEYNLIIYSEEGSVYSTSVNLADAEYDRYPYFDENKTLIADESVTINIYIDGLVAQTFEDASSGFVLDPSFDSVEIETFDRYQNRVIVKQNFK